MGLAWVNGFGSAKSALPGYMLRLESGWRDGKANRNIRHDTPAARSEPRFVPAFRAGNTETSGSL